MSASAGLPPVVPSTFTLQTWWHSVSYTLTVSWSLPCQKLPVPVAMPYPPPDRIGPMAGDESISSSVSAVQMRPPRSL